MHRVVRRSKFTAIAGYRRCPRPIPSSKACCRSAPSDRFYSAIFATAVRAQPQKACFGVPHVPCPDQVLQWWWDTSFNSPTAMHHRDSEAVVAAAADHVVSVEMLVRRSADVDVLTYATTRGWIRCRRRLTACGRTQISCQVGSIIWYSLAVIERPLAGAPP
jgi:hypothetical protein